MSRRPMLLLTALATLLLALNLRIPTTALGPLLPEIIADTGHGETFLSLLTSIPLALTLVVAPAVPRIAARTGRNRAVGWALVGIIAGTAIRSIPGDPALVLGTVLLGSAIAVGTVLVPATIAAEPAARRGVLTGVYTMSLSLGPALALGLTVPMMHASGSGWRGTLLLWAACGVLALLVWLVRSGAARSTVRSAADSASTQQAGAPKQVLGDPRVWMLALYLGITSLTFYTVSAWLPTVLISDGLGAGVAGGYASLVNFVAIPFAFVAPVAMRRGWTPLLAPVAPLVALAGVALMLTIGADAAPAISVLLGIAQGLCLGVSYGQIVEYAKTPEHTASVSALASAVGIAVAALGPLIFGMGLEVTDSHVPPMGGLGAVVLVQALLGLSSRAGSRS